jgi:hypothetical protein
MGIAIGLRCRCETTAFISKRPEVLGARITPKSKRVDQLALFRGTKKHAERWARGSRQAGILRFAHQHMYVLGHHRVTNNVKTIPALSALESAFEDVAGGCCTEMLLAAITGESHIMKLARALVAFQS